MYYDSFFIITTPRYHIYNVVSGYHSSSSGSNVFIPMIGYILYDMLINIIRLDVQRFVEILFLGFVDFYAKGHFWRVVYVYIRSMVKDR
jgi:hypothetical protein